MQAQRPRLLPIILILAVLISVAPMAATAGGVTPTSTTVVTTVGEALYNGGFEQGFEANWGCGGMVGAGWGCFQNGGAAGYGFYDDLWERTVVAGEHSQLIEINTKQAGGDADRNAGIYQTVSVWPGSEYDLSLNGMIRADDHGGDAWRYRVYVGFDYKGGSDWQAVTDWRELSWDSYYDRLSPGSFSSYSTTVKPTGDKLTVFVRTQRKWGDWYEETDFNLDNISLIGVVEVETSTTTAADTTSDSTGDTTASDDQTDQATEPALVCGGDNLLTNGDFEGGFENGIAKTWTGFNNGGHVGYGYYDEMWNRVISEGQHGQLLEINTLDVGSVTETDRISGIYQKVSLEAGVTYELSFDAMMRERADHSDEDFYRYMVEWGYSADGATEPATMDFWERAPLNNIYLRTAPGSMQLHTTRFVAPSKTTTLWIFAIKKWATLERELDVNIDDVALYRCDPEKSEETTTTTTTTTTTDKGAWCGQPGDVWYVVQRGDTLSVLALAYGTTVEDILVKNHIGNANWIYVGQVLCIPDPPGGTAYVPPAPSEPAPPSPSPVQPVVEEPVPVETPGAAPTSYRVERGDTLTGIAARFNTTVSELMTLNNIENANWIFAGQMLQLPG